MTPSSERNETKRNEDTQTRSVAIRRRVLSRYTFLPSSTTSSFVLEYSQNDVVDDGSHLSVLMGDGGLYSLSYEPSININQYTKKKTRI